MTKNLFGTTSVDLTLKRDFQNLTYNSKLRSWLENLDRNKPSMNVKNYLQKIIW
jgi:hypothetical protein